MTLNKTALLVSLSLINGGCYKEIEAPTPITKPSVGCPLLRVYEINASNTLLTLERFNEDSYIIKQSDLKQLISKVRNNKECCEKLNQEVKLYNNWVHDAN